MICGNVLQRPRRNTVIAVLYTDGQMRVENISKECVSGKWIPILVYRHKNSETPVVPVFLIQDTARTFSKRNLPKEWQHGAVTLSEEDIEIIKKKGWIFELFHFPKKICDRDDLDIGFEIHEFDDTPLMRTSK